MGKVENFLRHYVEVPYDPVKAHEYYIKNRDLKGRTTSGMSDKQKEAWDYVKNNVDEDKKKQVILDRDANTKKIDEFRATAVATRKRISDKLKLLSEQLSDDSADDREDISDKVKQDIDNVADIPEGVTGIQREMLVEKRNQEIAEIRDNASEDRVDISENTKDSRQTNRDSASDEREKTSIDLKALISKTRDEYTKAKETLKDSYEAIYAKEYRKVLDTVEGKPAVAAKATSTGKSASKAKAAPKAKKAAKPKAAKQGKIIYYTPAEMAYNRKH